MTIHRSLGMIGTGLAPAHLNSVICGGRLRLHVCKYVGAGTEAAADKIALMQIAKGQKIIPHLSYVTGDLADDTIKASIDGISGAIALNSGAAVANSAIVLDMDPESASRTVYATVTGVIPVGKTVYFGIVYTQV